MDQQFWDDQYRSRDQLFSGNPNGVLVTEVTGMTPGEALDVGCGEGGDALWLARQGWQVTGVDISQVAVDRAARIAAAEGIENVRFAQLDLTSAAPAAGAYDLVTMQYLALPVESGEAPLRGLLAAVAPGGTLLVGTHDLADLPPRKGDETFDPAAFHDVARSLAALLDDDWTVVVDESRLRTAPAPEGTPHVHDVVLRARRAA
ncbi:class I SAM-dependent methyltransferase [Actinoalloteichus hymeniacidonis]|uniref:Methyltransferase domain n=1 Tax=Actinoalloteichus hymeniacidonis TaxID=340345 RepID=A0AAC9MZQ1_9PSEU|nr:class I SAM-dependent methyltransferase [Actinoalloteichus hymeniacidonis]AOS64605.1 Methyltransferase domain [Actinoalloteichus hymeniacidonis]MBB5907322.1 2-polyprenyl-3-methyl-5-hydroxy-6-metoxy-1,4-benzoquinol methylase [Actinoalloteichus hymeniacidonis]